MTEFDRGIMAGILITTVVLMLVALFYGCGVMGVDDPPVLGKVGVGVPDRPPLPEGWRGEGDLWVNDLTQDTIYPRYETPTISGCELLK